jgi:hypothetical protein
MMLMMMMIPAGPRRSWWRGLDPPAGLLARRGV